MENQTMENHVIQGITVFQIIKNPHLHYRLVFDSNGKLNQICTNLNIATNGAWFLVSILNGPRRR